jgi:hypothetical protein
MFTDIVDSTSKLAELGDRQWRELLQRHHAIVRQHLVRFSGKEVDPGDPLRRCDHRRHPRGGP